jgi:hypothetical protein
MDMCSERLVLKACRPVTDVRMVNIVTHKPALFEFINRIVIFDDGVKVADRPKADVVAALNAGKVATAQAVRRSKQQVGIIQPDAEMMDTTPIRDTLLIEARMKPADVAFLRPDLPATIELSAYDFFCTVA